MGLRSISAHVGAPVPDRACPVVMPARYVYRPPAKALEEDEEGAAGARRFQWCDALVPAAGRDRRARGGGVTAAVQGSASAGLRAYRPPPTFSPRARTHASGLSMIFILR